MRVLLPLMAIYLLSLPLRAEDWKTTDGKVYINVQVIRVDDDAVTIIFKDGGALVPLSKLPPSLQQRFSYDPVKAKAAADARALADAQNAKKLEAERTQADKLKKQQQVQAANQISQGKAASSQ